MITFAWIFLTVFILTVVILVGRTCDPFNKKSQIKEPLSEEYLPYIQKLELIGFKDNFPYVYHNDKPFVMLNRGDIVVGLYYDPGNNFKFFISDHYPHDLRVPLDKSNLREFYDISEFDEHFKDEIRDAKLKKLI